MASWIAGQARNDGKVVIPDSHALWLSSRTRSGIQITPDTALRLARFFGGDAQSWMNLQVAYDLKIAEKAVARQIAKEVPTLAQMAAADERFALAA
jgi:hypothetical protein